MRSAIKTFLAAATASLLVPRLPLAADGSGADIVAQMNAEAANAIKRSQVVVWGAIDKGASAPPDTVELVAHRVFKGSLELPRLRVRIARKLSREDREEVSAWFLVRRRDGVYEEVAPASLMADYYFMDIAARIERTSFRGMQPRKIADGVVLDLGVDSGFGPVSKAPRGTARNDQLMLVAQITNFGPTRTVLGRSESSELDAGKGDPRIDLEIRDRAGRDAKRPDPRFSCGNLSELGDFVDLRNGETLKFMVSFHHDNLSPGTYTARLHYAVRRDIEGLNVDGSLLHPPDKGMLARAKTLWEGAAVSDWITFTVEAAPRRAR